MIQTGNAELDKVIAALTEQRNAAMDGTAMLAGKLSTAEALCKDLQAKLDEALKMKGSE